MTAADTADEHQAAIETCPDCGERTVKYASRHLPEPFWWCRRCHAAHVCACTRCEVWRALEAL